MNISRLQIKNFLSISDVEIKPGQINLVVGSNNAGKTTILRAIETAIKGSSDGSLVKRGEDAAELIVEFDNGINVRRRISAAGTQTVSVKKDEFKADAPQAMLNSLFDIGTFNPLDLLDPKSRNQAILRSIELPVTEEMIRTQVGDCPVPIPPLDYSAHGLKVADQAQKYFYQRRAEANKDLASKAERHRVRAAELPQLQTSTNSSNDAEIHQQINQRKEKIISEQGKKKLHEERITNRNNLLSKIDGERDTIVGLESKISGYEIIISAAQAEILLCQARQNGYQGDLAVLKELLKDSAVNQELIDQLNSETHELLAELTNRAQAKTIVQQHAAVEEIKKEVEVAIAFANKLSAVVDSLGTKFKSDLLARTELPISGLTYENDQFYLDGFSIDNLSTSASLKLAVAIAKKLSAKTKLICIDGAESLDEERYVALRDLIKDDGFCYFISRVGEAPATSGEQVIQMKEGAIQK